MCMLNARGFVLVIRNDATKTHELRTRLADLSNHVNSIRAKADAEGRSLTTEESREVEEGFSAFDALEAEIAQRERLESVSMRANTGLTQNPGPSDPSQPIAAAAGVPANAAPSPPRADHRRNVTPVTAPANDAGKFGFNSLGEFAKCVMRAQVNPQAADARLVRMAATTYGNEGAGADGGFAVPPDFRAAIMEKVMGESSLLSLTDQQTTSSNGFSFPKDETTPWQSSGGLQAYWESEGGTITQSKPALQTETVKAVKLSALVPVTDELLEDAPSLAGYLRRKVPEKMNYKINDAIIRGTGAGQPLGYLNAGCLVTVAAESGQAADTIRFDNIVKMYNRMYAPSLANARWVINQDVNQQLMAMQFPGTGTAVPVYLPPGGLSSAPYGTLLGRPIIVTEAASALGDVGDISLVDFSQYLSVAKTGGIRQDISIHLFFDQSVTAFRFVFRVGGQPWWSSAITRANSSNTLSAFVTLAAR